MWTVPWKIMQFYKNEWMWIYFYFEKCTNRLKCVCVLTYIPQCIAGHQRENPENEGLPGKADGVSGGCSGGARPSHSEWIQHKQEKEGAVCCFVFDDRLWFCSLFTSAVTAPVHLTMICFHFQNVTQELDEDLISLNEILEVGFKYYITSFDVQLISLALSESSQC